MTISETPEPGSLSASGSNDFAAATEPGAAVGGTRRPDLSELLREVSFRDLLDAAPDAMLVVGEDGLIATANVQAERLLGYAHDELLGQPMEVLVPGRERAGHPRMREAYFKQPRTRPMGEGLQLSAVRKNGTELPVEISLSPMQTKGGRVVIAALRDVSERRRLEARLVDASRLKSEFLANMSHELRTPLNAIIGFADLMHRGKVGPLADHHHEYLGDILTSARHLLQLINDILDLAKVESGKMELRPAPVEIAKVVREVKDILRGLAAAKRLRIEQQVDAEVETVVVDAARVKQILYNYLSNAIKFTPEEGVIRIRVAPLGPERFRIEVEDSGIGIAEDALSKLFVEFQQLDAGAAKKYQGTGLGLALTKRIAETHGGAVDVKSTPGRGSTFSVILPRESRVERDVDER